MTDRRRNFLIIAFVGALLAGALLLIVPGSPLSKPTRLGLDLKGGVELVYQGRPTPKVPEVTTQAIDDAIETIRKRTDALGVSEPEIQRAGSDQISIGLPDVENADRAIAQVGTTAQLQFYDWEPNLIGDPNAPTGGLNALQQTVLQASEAEPTAEPEDIPPGGKNDDELREADVDPNDEKAVQEFYDRKNDTGGDRYYLFGPDRLPIFTGGGDLPKTPAERAGAAYGPAADCEELLVDYEDAAPPEGQRGKAPKYNKDTECQAELEALGSAGPPAGSRIVKVPRGIVVIENERSSEVQATAPRSYYILEDDSELSGADIENPEVNTDQRSQLPVVTMEFTDAGRRAFARVTKRIAQRGSQIILPPGSDIEQAFQRFAITLDNKIVSLATINFRSNPEGIDGRTGAQIENIGSFSETQDLANNLRIGALPIELKLISQTQVSATLGKQALRQGLLAGGAGLVLVLFFLIGFYRILGAIAGVTLVTYAVLLFGLVKLIPITLTLPGIAGLILTLGVAADANIVIFERIKEEVRAGRSIAAAIPSGYAKALRTIIDANVVTIGVAFILFMLATGGVKGFAFTLGVGTLVSLLTAVLATSAVLGSLARTRLLRSRGALGAGEERLNTRIDFMGLSRWFFSVSGLILVAGALAIAGLGLNLGIDFESGTRIKTPLERPASVQDVRDALSPLGYGDAKIQEVDDPELGTDVIQVATTQLEPAEVTKVRDALDGEFGVRRAEFTSQSIGPTFGEQIARTALIAIIASLALISIYIGLRFEFKYAVPVLIALSHDILITAGVYAITEREVTTATVAAMLTILGYSLYDTIIVFDRIRENVPRMPRATFSQIVNRSMSEVVVRSLATSLSTLLPVTALMLFGGETLRDFAFALIVGIASGTYSSIFIASPVLWHWKEREPIYRRRRRMLREEGDGEIPAYAELDLSAGADDDDGGGSSTAVRRDRSAARSRAARRASRSGGGGPSATMALDPADEVEARAASDDVSQAAGPEADRAAGSAPGRPAPKPRGDARADADTDGEGGDVSRDARAQARAERRKQAVARRRKKHGRG